MEELYSGTTAKLNNEEVKNNVFVHPLPFNLIPHIDKFQVKKDFIFLSCFLIPFSYLGEWLYQRRNESCMGNFKNISCQRI